jgi:hypothetical protein
MPDADMPLSAVLELEETSAKDNTITRESVSGAVKLVEEVIREIPSLRLLDVGPDVVRELAASLRTPLSGIAITAWNKRDEIRKYADPSRYPPDQTNVVWLSEHQLKQTVKPSVEVRVGVVPLPKLVFTASVTLTLHGAKLVIRAGKITHVRLGDVTAATQLSAGKAELIKRNVKTWSLPGELALGDGVRIGQERPSSTP